MNVVNEILAAARELSGAVGRIKVHKGRQAVSAVYDEEPDLDDVLYYYEQGIQETLRKKGPYVVNASWRGRPHFDKRGDVMVMDGAIEYEVFIETMSALDIERVVVRETKQG